MIPDAGAAPPRPRALTTTATRIAREVTRQTRQLRRTTKLLIVGLAAVLGAFGWMQWRGTEDARALARLQAGAERLQANGSRGASWAWPTPRTSAW